MKFSLIAIFAVMVVVLGCRCPEPSGANVTRLERFEFNEPQMGVPFNILVYAPDEATAESASRAAFERISALNRIMSNYETDSELKRRA